MTPSPFFPPIFNCCIVYSWRPTLIGAQLPLTTAGMGTAMISHGEWHNRRQHNCVASDLATAATHCYRWHTSPPTSAAAARRRCRLPPPAAATTASISCHCHHHRRHSVGKSEGAGAGAGDDADGDAEGSSSIVNIGVSKFHVHGFYGGKVNQVNRVQYCNLI